MNIEGMYTLQASPTDVWQCLKEKELLLHAIPGLVRFERIDQDTYSLALHINNAPLMGMYNGQVNITEYVPPYDYHIAIKNTDVSCNNTISGNGGIHLQESDGNTTISYRGNITLGKRGARLPSVMIKGAAKLLLQQFFAALSEQVHLYRNTSVTTPQESADAGVVTQQIVVLPQLPEIQTAPVQEEKSILLSITRLLGLGNGDPVQEGRWATRIQGFSTISVLLLLLWIGTRLLGKR